MLCLFNKVDNKVLRSAHLVTFEQFSKDKEELMCLLPTKIVTGIAVLFSKHCVLECQRIRYDKDMTKSFCGLSHHLMSTDKAANLRGHIIYSHRNDQVSTNLYNTLYCSGSDNFFSQQVLS